MSYHRSKEAAEYRGLYSLGAWRGPKGRRKAQLKAEPLCRFCDLKGRVTAANVADHIEPHRGDLDAFLTGELQSLCERCHNKLKQQVETMGYHLMCDAEGYPLDPLHPANRKKTKPD